jgi:hypothetical protein
MLELLHPHTAVDSMPRPPKHSPKALLGSASRHGCELRIQPGKSGIQFTNQHHFGRIIAAK